MRDFLSHLLSIFFQTNLCYLEQVAFLRNWSVLLTKWPWSAPSMRAVYYLVPPTPDTVIEGHYFICGDFSQFRGQLEHHRCLRSFGFALGHFGLLMLCNTTVGVMFIFISDCVIVCHSIIYSREIFRCCPGD